MLVDTDVLIWVSRGREQAIEYLDSLDRVLISDVTYMELIQGAMNKREADCIDQTLKNMNVRRLAIQHNISNRAVGLVRAYFHSHSMQLADALIGATALAHNLELLSGNAKHFSVIDGLVVHRFML